MNIQAIRAIYRFEMSRTFRTLFQSIATPVITTSLYFVVFGSAIGSRMIAVLEVHDSTGWSEQASAVNISNAVTYWTSADIRAAINGQENFVIINIANEPFGNTTTSNYLPQTLSAIQSLRSAGLTHTLMIDGATWGQDWSGTMVKTSRSSLLSRRRTDWRRCVSRRRTRSPRHPSPRSPYRPRA